MKLKGDNEQIIITAITERIAPAPLHRLRIDIGEM